MEIRRTVQAILKSRICPPDQAMELLRLLQAREPTGEEREALDRLREALESGEVRVPAAGRYRNIMEELVWAEVERRCEDPEVLRAVRTNLHDIMAYALNRLPPLYATSLEGASFQRRRAQEALADFVALRVEEAIATTAHRPDWHPERLPLADDPAPRLLDVLRHLGRESGSGTGPSD
ncbi:late competence development ComFB family protein [Deferrisoma palaeochoriense]